MLQENLRGDVVTSNIHLKEIDLRGRAVAIYDQAGQRVARGIVSLQYHFGYSVFLEEARGSRGSYHLFSRKHYALQVLEGEEAKQVRRNAEHARNLP